MTGSKEISRRRPRPSLEEVLHRIRDPEWIVSHAFRQITEAYDLLSPSEFSRTYRKIRQLTMCSNARLRGLYHAVEYVVTKNIAGDVVECGTALGGSAALMGLALNRLGASERTLWAFDTFEGLPPPTEDDPDFEIAKAYAGSCIGTIEDVTTSFERLGIRERTKFVKGLFEDTLPRAEIKQIAVLHIDGDWYKSVRTCLECLYDKVAEGGVIQIDDYGFWQGARIAVDEFFAGRSTTPNMRRLDYSGRQFIKSA